MLENLSHRAIISRLYSAAEEQLQEIEAAATRWHEWYDAVEQLPTPEKMVYVILKMNQTVTNGGFAEFYERSVGIFAPEIVHVLQEIKAEASAQIVASTLPIVNPAVLLDDAYKALVFQYELAEQQRTQLYPMDVQYDQLQDHENLEDLLGSYLKDTFF